MAQSIVVGSYITRYTPLKQDVRFLTNYIIRLKDMIKRLKVQKKIFRRELKILQQLQSMEIAEEKKKLLT